MLYRNRNIYGSCCEKTWLLMRTDKHVLAVVVLNRMWYITHQMSIDLALWLASWSILIFIGEHQSKDSAVFMCTILCNCIDEIVQPYNYTSRNSSFNFGMKVAQSTQDSSKLKLICLKHKIYNYVILFLKIVFCQAYSTDTDAMLSLATFHLGFHCLSKYSFIRIKKEKKVIIYSGQYQVYIIKPDGRHHQ